MASQTFAVDAARARSRAQSLLLESRLGILIGVMSSRPLHESLLARKWLGSVSQALRVMNRFNVLRAAPCPSTHAMPGRATFDATSLAWLSSSAPDELIFERSSTRHTGQFMGRLSGIVRVPYHHRSAARRAAPPFAPRGASGPLYDDVVRNRCRSAHLPLFPGVRRCHDRCDEGGRDSGATSVAVGCPLPTWPLLMFFRDRNTGIANERDLRWG